MTTFFDARDAACQMLAERDGRPVVEHSDPAGGYGYVQPKHGAGSRFVSALGALKLAKGARDFSALFLADNLAKSGEVDAWDLRRYRRAAAAHEYAKAVYDVEAAEVRAT